ncbi:MAG TPA: DUF4143 domain-containing protein [Geobacteraceae bacterium]|nr:DUF4143 domain-containing protein [Geobacteraceae bacterium]
MTPRIAASIVLDLATKFPFVAVTGPRQSGKSTLIRASFPDKPYISLQDPDICEFASSSPRDFLNSYPEGAILDEAQRSPKLLSHIISRTTADENKGPFFLTGPLPLSVLSGGRIGIVRLLPLSISELAEAGDLPADIDELLYRGMYPTLQDASVIPSTWYPLYISSYLDRDVRRVVNIRDLTLFQRFIRLCAAQTGRIVNFSMMAKECGITHNTARAWLSILEASHLLFFLQPHHRSFNKRLVKTPKLYFCDTGLAAWLLGIGESARIATHPLRDALFETWVVSELMKGRFNRGLPANLYFWRDNVGNEIDIIANHGDSLVPIEIKTERTLSDEHLQGLRKWLSLAGNEAGRGRLIYAGNERQRCEEAAVIPWRELDGLAGRL